MGRGISAHPKALSPQNQIQYRNRTAFAVGSGNGNHTSQTGTINLQAFQHQADPVKPHINDLTMLAVDLLQPAFQGVRHHSCLESTEGGSEATWVSTGAGRCISLARTPAIRERISRR